MHGDRRATFIRMDGGAAIIRHWGESHALAVAPESLTHPPSKRALAGAAEPPNR
jgi:hypothetical protein